MAAKLRAVLTLLVMCAALELSGCSDDAAADALLRAHDWQLMQVVMPGGQVEQETSLAIDFHFGTDRFLYVGNCQRARAHLGKETMSFKQNFAVDYPAGACVEIPDQTTSVYIAQKLLKGKATWTVNAATLVIDHGSAGKLILNAVPRSSTLPH